MLRFTDEALSVTLGGCAADMLAIMLTVVEGTAVSGDTMVTLPLLVPADNWLVSTLMLMVAERDPVVEESTIQGALAVAV